MEDLEALVKRVIESEKTINDWKDDFKSVERTEASKLNKLLYGKQFNSAKGCECVNDLFIVLKSKKTLLKLKMMSKKQFILLPGKLIQFHGCDHVSEHSSDEAMIAMLKRNPNYIKQFKSYPENWEEIVENYEPSTEDTSTGAGSGSGSEGGGNDTGLGADVIDGRKAFLAGMGYVEEGEEFAKDDCDSVSLETINSVADSTFYKPFTKALISDQLKLREIEFETDANKNALIELVKAVD